LGDLLRQLDRWDKVRILTDDYGYVESAFISESDQIDRDTHVHSLFLTSGTDTPLIDIDSLTAEKT
jgi:hypothetical protein